MIIETFKRTAPEIVEGFRKLLAYDSVTCAVADCMGRFGGMTGDMKPLFPGIRLVGTAVTAKALASDIAAPMKAIDTCQPGDIIVIDAHGSVNTAFWGENMSMSAMNMGAIATVVDGACRDVEEIRKIPYPVICKSIVPTVASVSGYGEVNVPVSAGGVVTNPGDVVIIDENGVVVVPQAIAADILEKATKLLETEHIVQSKIAAGTTIGKLINIDAIFGSTFAYQDKAAEKK